MDLLLFLWLLIAENKEQFIELRPMTVKSVVFLASNPEDDLAYKTTEKLAESLTNQANYITVVLGSCSNIWKGQPPTTNDPKYKQDILTWLKANKYDIAAIYATKVLDSTNCYRALLFEDGLEASYVDINVNLGWSEAVGRFEEALQTGGLPWTSPSDMATIQAGKNNPYTYLIDRYEFPNQKDQYPMVLLSWHQAQKACSELGKRLCTVEEWVRACRGKSNYLYPYGNDYDMNKCRINEEKYAATKKIGHNAECRSDYGVYDMLGNVKEWVIGEEGKSGNFQPMLGGAWFHKDLINCIGPRSKMDPRFSFSDLGFRCCK